MKKRLAVAVGLAVLLVGWFVLFRTSPTPVAGGYVVDLDGLRATAAAPSEELPTDVRVLHVADGDLPKFFVMAGNGSGNYSSVYAAFQVLTPDAGTVLIDTAYDRAGYEALDGTLTTFHDDAWLTLEKAMSNATAIVLTHEHPDHIGGVARSKNVTAHAQGRLLLTQEQLDNALAEPMTGLKKDAVAGLKPIAYEKLYRVAPGVALQRAPGHSPGSQLVYVRRADGRELLFVGDIAWNHDSFKALRMRPLAASLFLHEQRQPVIDQIAALKKLLDEHPEVQVVVAHDGAALERLEASGLVTAGFVE